jgi:hypothetical protein
MIIASPLPRAARIHVPTRHPAPTQVPYPLTLSPHPTRCSGTQPILQSNQPSSALQSIHSSSCNQSIQLLHTSPVGLTPCFASCIILSYHAFRTSTRVSVASILVSETPSSRTSSSRHQATHESCTGQFNPQELYIHHELELTLLKPSEEDANSIVPTHSSTPYFSKTKPPTPLVPSHPSFSADPPHSQRWRRTTGSSIVSSSLPSYSSLRPFATSGS